MKKIYLLPLLLAAFSASAQYSLDFDAMNIGAVSPQSPYISVWTGGTDCNVVDIQANSGTQSVQVRNNTTDDIVILLGNQTTGSWKVSFNMYIPTNATGYWNIQESETPGVQWNGEFWVGATAQGGTAGIITSPETGNTITFPYDQWFSVVHEINLDTKKLTVTVDESVFINNLDYVGTGGVPANQLGSINFYSIDINNNVFIDDFVFEEVNTTSITTNNSVQFSVYPNPVKDLLTVNGENNITNVSVFNALGVRVHSSTPNSTSTQIDMSKFVRGIYLVKVTTGTQTRTVKVFK